MLTATVEQDVMIVHLQQALTRERVTAARIDVELTPIGNGNRGSVRQRADPRRDGTYVVRHMLLATPGQYRVSFVLDAGAERDVLTGVLSLTPTAATESHRHEQVALGGAAAIVLLLVILVASRWPRRFD